MNVSDTLMFFSHSPIYGMFPNGGLSLPISQRTLAGIRHAGKERGRGQVDGLIWQQVERVCTFAEADKTIAGLRDSASRKIYNKEKP